MEDMRHDILHQLHPAIRKYVQFIWAQNVIGVSSRTIKIINPSSSVKNGEGSDNRYANKFFVSIPYAGRLIEWEVKFSNDDMDFAPDFDVGDDFFLGELSAESMSIKIPSWNKWDAINPASLYNCLREMMYLYKSNQIRKLESDRFARIHFEFAALMGQTELSERDVEVEVDSSGIVHFLITLKVDFSILPLDFLKNSAVDVKVVLMVTFPRTDGTNVHPQIFFIPPIDQILLGFGNKQIPPFPSDGCLMDYVPAVQKLLQDKIQFIVDNHLLKQAYIVHLLSQHTFNVIEYDTRNYSKATLLFETDNFFWLLTIVIGNTFPKDKPKWTLRSIYQTHISYDEPVTEVLHDYPYSPRWCPGEMIKRALKYAVDKIPQFQIKKK